MTNVGVKWHKLRVKIPAYNHHFTLWHSGDTSTLASARSPLVQDVCIFWGPCVLVRADYADHAVGGTQGKAYAQKPSWHDRIMAHFCGVREGASDENHDPRMFLGTMEPDPTQIHCGGVCSLSALSLVS